MRIITEEQYKLVTDAILHYRSRNGEMNKLIAKIKLGEDWADPIELVQKIKDIKVIKNVNV